MKLDEDVKMISAETPLLISKACELFIIELAYRGWIHTIESNRRTLQRNDIAQAISHNDFYDFLLDIVEESCKSKLLYNYSKEPSLPMMGIFNNYPLNINNNQPQINNNFNNIINLDEEYMGRINNKNINMMKDDNNEKNIKNNIDYNLNNSDFYPNFINSSKNNNLNLCSK